jgi:nucleoside-diphosphate-sugar epimerase
MKLPADKVAQLRSFYDGRPVCVTGGAGFIGGHLVDALVSLGATVAVLDDLSNSTLEHLAGLIELEPQRVRFVHGSVLDDQAMDDAAAGASVIFHLGAIGSVPRSMSEPQRVWSVNATGTVRVLEAARRARAQRVMLAASSSAYGDLPGATPESQLRPKHEGIVPRPLSPYAASKLAAENALAAWSAAYGLSTVSLRYFNIFGPRQSADSAYAAVVAAFASKLLKGEAPVIFGDGTQSRDFTYVANAVLATLLSGASPAPLMGDVLNVATGRRVTVLELAQVMAERCGEPHLRPQLLAERPGDVKHSLADLTRVREVLGFEPVATLEEGLGETIAWYREAMASR